MPQIGDQAPSFTLQDDKGQPFVLSENLGKRLLLVFYPGDNTPVCTRQLCDYRDGVEEFAGLNVQVVGISGDDTDSHQKFRQKHDLPFTLLSDPGLNVAEQYGARGIMGMKRAVFLLDESGIIRYQHIESLAVFRRRREEILEAIRQLDNNAD